MTCWPLIVALAAATWLLLAHASDSPGHLAAELLDAALCRHPHDPRVRLARRSIRRVHADSEPADMVNRARMTVRRGKFDRCTGDLHVSVVNSAGSPLPPAVVRNAVVHEVAHAGMPDGRHSEQWRDMYVALLRVATEDLGWSVALECSACRFYRVCGARDCPRCARMACRAPRSTV